MTQLSECFAVSVNVAYHTNYQLAVETVNFQVLTCVLFAYAQRQFQRQSLTAQFHNFVSASDAELLVMFCTILTEFLLALDTVDCGQFHPSCLTITTSLTTARLTLYTRQLFHRQEIGNEEVLRQIFNSTARNGELFPTQWTGQFVSRLFVSAPLPDTLETVRVSTRQYSRVRVHFSTDRTFRYIVQLLRCRHFRLEHGSNTPILKRRA